MGCVLQNESRGGPEICFCSVFGCLGYCPILYLIYQRSLGGGFKHFVFLPLLVLNDPIWPAYISNGLKQPSTVGFCFLTLEIDNSVIFCLRCGVSQVYFGRSRFLDVYRLIPWNDSHWISRVPNWSCYRLPFLKLLVDKLTYFAGKSATIPRTVKKKWYHKNIGMFHDSMCQKINMDSFMMPKTWRGPIVGIFGTPCSHSKRNANPLYK